MAIVIPSNLAIIVKLFRQKQARLNMTNNPSSETDSQTQKTTLMIVSASLAFVAMSAPLSIYLMIRFRDSFDGKDQIIPILGFIYRLSPTVNFYCYFLSGGLFKQEVKKWLSELLPVWRSV